MAAEGGSTGLHIQAQNLARRTFGHDFERTTADFAIRGEALEWLAGVHDHLKALATVRAHDGFGFFHGETLSDFTARANGGPVGMPKLLPASVVHRTFSLTRVGFAAKVALHDATAISISLPEHREEGR